MKIKLQDAFAGCIIFLIVLNLGILNIADLTTLYRYFTSVLALILGVGCLCSAQVYSKIKNYCHFMNVWLVILFVFFLKGLFSIVHISGVCFLLMMVFVFAAVTCYHLLNFIAIKIDFFIENKRWK